MPGVAPAVGPAKLTSAAGHLVKGMAALNDVLRCWPNVDIVLAAAHIVDGSDQVAGDRRSMCIQFLADIFIDLLLETALQARVRRVPTIE